MGVHAVGVCDDGAGAQAGPMRVLEGRAEAFLGTFNAQTWQPRCGRRGCLPFSAPLMEEVDGFKAQRLVSLGKAVCLNTAELCQLH